MENQVPIEALILLSVSVIVIALFRWIRLAHVLGYLFVGMLIGPYGLSWLKSGPTTQLLSELGVVFLMFSIGLEFSRARLLRMKLVVFGLGGMQVTLTLLVVMGVSMLAGLDFSVAFIVGGVIAMSSTAIVVKQLAEQLELSSRHGRLSISILLFQDLAVIPFLIVIPALGVLGAGGEVNMLGSLVFMLFKGLGISAAMILVGYWVLRPLFHVVAMQRSNELFMLAVLSVALTASWITHEAGLSLTLGAFLAGMMLGETEFKHQIETDIRPFQDVFLGLFFVSIGMLLDFGIVIQYWPWIVLLVFSLLIIKLSVIFGLAKLMKHTPGVSVRTALILAHGGEFGFVMLSEALHYNLLNEQLSQIVLAAVISSMVISTFLIRYNGLITKKILAVMRARYGGGEASITENIETSVASLTQHVIICGYGWTGQGIARMLEKNGYEFIALDLDPAKIREAREAGDNVVYGDPARGSILNASGIRRACAMIITHTNTPATLKVLAQLRTLNITIPVLVRTRDESTIECLKAGGATEVIADTYEVSNMLSNHLLLLLGGSLSSVLRRSREMHRQRYQRLSGFFPGEEHDETVNNSGHGLLRSVILESHYKAVGKTLAALDLMQYGVEVISVKRNGIKGTEPQPDLIFRTGDVLVLSGKYEALLNAEARLVKLKLL